MPILSRIWTEVRRGENIDLYLIVVVALSLAILNIVGIAPGTAIAPITLAVLGLIAISTLVNRYRIEEVLHKLSQSADTFFLNEFPPTLKSDIESATEVLFVGVTLSRTIKTYYSLIETKLRMGHAIKVLLVQPEGVALEMAETRVYGRADMDRAGVEIRGVLRDLCDLNAENSHSLELRTIESPLTFGVIAINSSSTSGTLYLEHYSYKLAGGSKPKFILRSKDGHWYEHFRQEIHALWEDGDEWQCQ